MKHRIYRYTGSPNDLELSLWVIESLNKNNIDTSSLFASGEVGIWGADNLDTGIKEGFVVVVRLKNGEGFIQHIEVINHSKYNYLYFDLLNRAMQWLKSKGVINVMGAVKPGSATDKWTDKKQWQTLYNIKVCNINKILTDTQRR